MVFSVFHFVYSMATLLLFINNVRIPSCVRGTSPLSSILVRFFFPFRFFLVLSADPAVDFFLSWMVFVFGPLDAPVSGREFLARFAHPSQIHHTCLFPWFFFSIPILFSFYTFFLHFPESAGLCGCELISPLTSSYFLVLLSPPIPSQSDACPDLLSGFLFESSFTLSCYSFAPPTFSAGRRLDGPPPTSLFFFSLSLPRQEVFLEPCPLAVTFFFFFFPCDFCPRPY